MMADYVYLDNAATTFPKPEPVYAIQDKINRTLAVNAGRGSYRASQQATQIIEDCRSRMARLAGCREDHLIFAPSATIAMNQIILGLAWDAYKTVYVSPYEHNAVIRPLHRICKLHGISLKTLATAADGSLDPKQIAIQFAQQAPDYVFMTHVSNVTGYILPLRSVSDIAHNYHALVIADCAQSMGLLNADLHTLGADFLVFAAHKTLYGSFGLGGWAARDAQMLSPVICGGTGSDSLNPEMPGEMPGRFEAASPNIIALAALDAALKWRDTIAPGEIEARERRLSTYLMEGLRRNRNIHVYMTADAATHIAVVSFNHKSYMADELGMILDQDFNIAVRTGYHCAPLVHDMIGSVSKRGTVRVSISYFTTEADIDALLDALRELD